MHSYPYVKIEELDVCPVENKFAIVRPRNTHSVDILLSQSCAPLVETHHVAGNDVSRYRTFRHLYRNSTIGSFGWRSEGSNRDLIRVWPSGPVRR
jgi:hypothetical protein